MNWQQHFTRNRLLILAGAGSIYAGLWCVTALFGSPEVRRVAIKEMHVPPHYIDLSERRGSFDRPVFFCRSRAYAPLLIRADYGWHREPLAGEAVSALYLWLFGRTFRLTELNRLSE